MINKFYYTLNKKELINITFIGFITFVFFQNYNHIILNNILPLVLSLIIIIFLLVNNVNNNFSKMMIQNNKIKSININKYPNISHDIEIIEIIIKLENSININRFEFNKFVKYIDNFFKIIKEFKNKTIMEAEYYDLALDESKKVLNTLNNIIVSSIQYNVLKSDRKFNIKYNNDLIKNISSKLELIFSNYLKKMELKINSSWYKNDINIYSKPIYPNDIKPIEKSKYNKYYLY
jgi:hypothetical protein